MRFQQSWRACRCNRSCRLCRYSLDGKDLIDPIDIKKSRGPIYGEDSRGPGSTGDPINGMNPKGPIDVIGLSDSGVLGADLRDL